MTSSRKRKFLVAGCLVATLLAAGLFPVRDLLAAFFIFAVLFGGLATIALVSFLFGGGVMRCYELLLDFAAWSGLLDQHP